MDTRYTRLAFLLTLSLGLSACANLSNENDPYEKYNRAVFRFNNTADHYVMQPVARGYRTITPKPVRSAVSNFFNNLRDVVSFGSNVLRGNVKNAGYDFMRVAVNSTFGIGGLIDVASTAGMPNNKNHLGDTFASWGWKNSHYFVVPFLGPSTVRDTVGNTITTVYSPNNLLIHDRIFRYSSTGLNAVNRREQLLDATDALEEMKAPDSYAYMRDLYMGIRNKQTGNINTQSEDNIDDLVAPVDNTLSNSSQPVETDPAIDNAILSASEPNTQ